MRKPTHPSKILLVWLENQLNLEEGELESFLAEDTRCNIDLTIKLSKLTGTTEELWTNLQKSCDVYNGEEGVYNYNNEHTAF
jgi:plasmid maintenance system antidote protein VapI